MSENKICHASAHQGGLVIGKTRRPMMGVNRKTAKASLLVNVSEGDARNCSRIAVKARSVHLMWPSSLHDIPRRSVRSISFG